MSHISYYAEALGHGRAIMRCDITDDNGDLVESHTVGSPAPLATVQAAARSYPLGRVRQDGTPANTYTDADLEGLS